MSIKQHVLDLLAFAHRTEQALIDSLSDDERAFAGSLEQWSAKDMLAHLYAWKVRYANNLDILQAGGTPDPVDDIDQTNAAIYAEHQHKTWDEALTEWAQANANLCAFSSSFC